MTLNIYLGSLLIIIVGTAMGPSPLLQWREIPHIAGLIVLSHSADGVESSGEKDRGSQVYSAVQTKMLDM